MKLVTFGEIVWDVYPDQQCLGGAPLNFAAHAAALGAETYLISAVGNDELGRAAREALHRFGVNDRWVVTVPAYPTGQCMVTLDDRAVPQYRLLENTAYDHLQKCTPMQAEALVFGTLIQRSENNGQVLRHLLENGQFGDVFCDVNLRAPYYNRASVEQCLQVATVLKVSREELPTMAALVFGKMLPDYAAEARRLMQQYPNIRVLIITLDSDGAYALDATGQEYYHAAEPVAVVSTVGAGDSFGAAFLVSYLQTHNISQALAAAIHRSAMVVTHKEAVPMDN